MNSTPRLIVLAATAVLLGTATARSQQTSAPDLQPAQPGKRVENPFYETQRATANVTVRAVSGPQSHNILGVTAGAKGAGGSLFIRTSDLDPEAQSQLQEDLKVMSRIVEKATQSEPTRGPRAMGIELVLGRGASSVRSLYLESYGALFIAEVNFLLLPLPVSDQAETSEVEKEAVTTWEQTRQELYGNPVPPQPMLPMGWISNNTEPMKYDEAKVDRLRQDLIDALKNASNIRQLAPDESITIYVQGQSATPLLQAVHVPDVRRSGGQSSFEQRLEQIVVRHELADEPTRAVMTLQASKSDIDRFARGEITTKEFRELIRSRIYLSGSWNTPDHLFLNNH